MFCNSAIIMINFQHILINLGVHLCETSHTRAYYRCPGVHHCITLVFVYFQTAHYYKLFEGAVTSWPHPSQGTFLILYNDIAPGQPSTHTHNYVYLQVTQHYYRFTMKCRTTVETCTSTVFVLIAMIY